MDFTTDTQPTAIRQWYDRHTRSWITQLVDADGQQVGEATYDGNRASAKASLARAQRLLDNMVPGRVSTCRHCDMEIRNVEDRGWCDQYGLRCVAWDEHEPVRS